MPRWAAFVAPATCYAVVWLPFLITRPIWSDEAATLVFAAHSPPELWQAIGHVDRSTGFYYLLMSPFTLLAEPLFWIRAVSWSAMSLAFGFLGLIAHRLWGWLGLGVATLFCVSSPLIGGYGIEARGYALAVFCFAFASWLLLTGLSRPQLGARRMLAHSLALSVMAALNFLFVAQLIAHVPALFKASRADRLRIVAAWIPPVATGVLLAWASSHQRGQLTWLHAPSVTETLWGVVLLAGTSYAHFAVWLVVILAAPIILWRRGSARDRAAGATLLVWYAGPIVALAVLSHLVSPVLHYRYVLPSALASGLLCAGAIAVMLRRRPRLGFAVAGLIGVGLAVSGALGPTGTSPPRQSEELSELVTANAQVGDVVAVTQSYELTGQLGMVGYALDDPTIFERAEEKVLDGPEGWDYFTVVSTSPWRTAPAQEPRGRVIELVPDWVDAAVPGCRGRQRLGSQERTVVTVCRR